MDAITIFDRAQAAEAQRRYCEEHHCPEFAPDDGWCVVCGKNIYDAYTARNSGRTYGICVETAGKKLITSCPHCNASFTD